ncbi:peptidase [Cryobacterium suzukii]|uniref:peptidase n=1 Tax=Cryobacterium suzukii TaxID=1259198 RepID=UPI001581A4CB|nr:peptidase [Cryobacterium suzukii]
MRIQPVVAVVLAVIVGLLVPSVPSAQAAGSSAPAGSIGLRLLDIPANATDDPRARLYIVDHVAPGAVIERRIDVANGLPDATTINLYSGAASITAGAFLGAEGKTPNDLSTWTSVDRESPTVPAGGSVTATVTITVPADAAPGEQYGVVWAEVSAPPTSGDGVTVVNRVGIRIYLSVGPGGAPAADFLVGSLTAARSADGQPTVVASVQNTGGRALDVFGTLQLMDGPGGLSAGPFPVVLGTTVGIGDTEPVTIVLDKEVPDGPWDATITLHSGLLERSANATITFPDAGTAAAVPLESGPPGWLYLAIIGLLLLLIIIALLVWRRRRRDDDSDDRAAIGYGVVPADAY